MQHYKDIITVKKKMISNKEVNKNQVWHYKVSMLKLLLIYAHRTPNAGSIYLTGG